MCGSKKSSGSQVMPAQAVSAQPVSADAAVKTAIKQDYAQRNSGADTRSDALNPGTTPNNNAPNTPDTGEVSLGAKKKRKGIVGLDL